MVFASRPSRHPTNGEIAISVTATGICGSDLHGLTGDTGRRVPGQVMGHETAGVISELGPGIEASWLGRPVTVNPNMACGHCAACARGEDQECESAWVLGVRADVDGAFAERVVVPLRSVQPLPPGMPTIHAAIAEPLAVGFHAAQRGCATADDKVLIIGAGPIGQSAVLGCQRLGVVSVLVSEPDQQRAANARRLGVPVITPDALSSSVTEVLGGPASLVLDAVGSTETLNAAIRSSKRGGRIVLVGMAAPDPVVDAYAITGGERILIGTYCYSDREFRGTVSWLAEHPTVFDILVDRIVPMSDGPATFDALMSGALVANKVLLTPSRLQSKSAD